MIATNDISKRKHKDPNFMIKKNQQNLLVEHKLQTRREKEIQTRREKERRLEDYIGS